MPNLKTHCKSSLSRTGKTYEDLHKWMDESQEFLGITHRKERHDNTYIPYIMEKWGKEGVLEFLHHIIDDYQDTLSKYNGKCAICGKDTWKGKKLCLRCYKFKTKAKEIINL